MGEESLNKKDFLKLCKAIEILIFRHSTVLKRDAKVLEGVFYQMINDLREGKSITGILENFKKQEAMKAEKQFEIAFAEFVTTTHKVARYVLWKIEEDMSGKKQAGLDWDSITLEHILAEKLDWDGRDEYLEWLGNLTLLSPEFNNKAGNRSFKEKRIKVYKNDKRVKITQDLMKYKDFTKDTIINRQKELAKSAERIWSSKNII